MKNLQSLYNQDHYLWLNQNAQLLREGKISEIDIPNIAEELETMSKNQYRELIGRLKIVLSHLLKWEFGPPYRPISWKRTILEHRQEINDLLEISPSLKLELDVKIDKAYRNAVEFAALETGIPKSNFPKTCPYSWDDALNIEFYPD